MLGEKNGKRDKKTRRGRQNAEKEHRYEESDRKRQLYRRQKSGISSFSGVF
jgi:hypothetical protein